MAAQELLSVPKAPSMRYQHPFLLESPVSVGFCLGSLGESSEHWVSSNPVGQPGQ